MESKWWSEVTKRHFLIFLFILSSCPFFFHFSLTNLLTKTIENIPDTIGDSHQGRDWPLTLAPRIVRDKFAIDVNTVIILQDSNYIRHEKTTVFLSQAAQIQPTSVVKTEYSTFTYFITSLDGSQTVTSTDIVVSSNVVTETVLQPTPTLEPLASSNYVRFSYILSTTQWSKKLIIILSLSFHTSIVVSILEFFIPLCKMQHIQHGMDESSLCMLVVSA